MEYITFWRTLPNGAGLVTLEVYQLESGTKVCGIHHIEGRLNLPPKKWLATMRAELLIIEENAKKAGCGEVRIAGRDWSNILRDYEPIEGIPNGLRKVL
jgi:hypothetical protein